MDATKTASYFRSVSIQTDSEEKEGVGGYRQASCKFCKREETPALSIIKRHVSEICNSMGFPALKYVIEPGRNGSERYMWMVVLCIILTFICNYFKDEYNKWLGSPVLFTLNDSLTPISQVPFPAVTFCPTRRVSNALQLTDMLRECEEESNCSQSKRNLFSAAHLLCPTSGRFQSVGKEVYISSLDNGMEKVAVSCEQVIEWFKFGKGDYHLVNTNHSVCSQHFQTLFVDDSSVCFSFNMLPAMDLFRDHVIPPAVDNTDFVTKDHWSPDSTLESSDETTIPRYVNSSGIWSGLYFAVSNFTADDGGVCGEAKTAAKLFIHHPAEIPTHLTHDSIDFPLHKQLVLRLLPSLMTTSALLSRYPPEDRRCYFSNERPLSLFKIYTQRNCQLECRVNCSLSLCDCVPFYFPRGNSSVKVCAEEDWTSCNPFLVTGIMEGRFTWRDILVTWRHRTGQRIQRAFLDYESIQEEGKKLTEELLDETYPDCVCDCPPPCNTLQYAVKVEEGQPLHPSFLLKNFSTVAISFKEFVFPSVLRKELTTVLEFLAHRAGVLGVFTGFSLMAFCELVYFLTLRLWSTIKHAWDDDDSVPLEGKGQRVCLCCGLVHSGNE